MSLTQSHVCLTFRLSQSQVSSVPGSIGRDGGTDRDKPQNRTTHQPEGTA